MSPRAGAKRIYRPREYAALVRVGVIGVGSMGQAHVRVFSEIADLVGVADPDHKVGMAVADRFSTSYFPDHRALLKENLEAVSVCAPTHLHYPIASDVVGAGINVLVEKPMCGAVHDAQRLTAAARKANVTMAVGHIERHNPVVDHAKRSLEAGEYGDLITASARRVSSFPDRVRDVGVIQDLGIHEFSVLRYLVGAPVKSVFSVGGQEKHATFEDHATILLQYGNGVTGVVEVNWLTPMKVRRLALTCSKNFVELDYQAQSVTISSAALLPYDPANLYLAPFEYDVRQVLLKKEEPLRRELLDFLDAIKQRRDPKVTGEEAVETLAVVDAAVRSHRSGQVVHPAVEG